MARLSRKLMLTIIFGAILNTFVLGEKETPKKKRYAVPVPGAHIHEVVREGRYGFTGEHRLVSEHRLADGTIEGESLYIRPDGRPVKVHYFGDGRGSRPKVEVLHKEHRITTAHHAVPVPVPARVPTVVETRRVVVPEVRQVVDVISPPPSSVVVPPRPAVVIPPPRESSGVSITDARTGQGVHVGSNGGDVAAAVPSVTAIVGPGAHAVIQPEAEAHSANGASFRTIGSGGDVSIANPQVTAIAGAGSSVVIAPKARASSGVAHPPSVVREVHHHAPPPQIVAPAITAVQRAVPVPVPVPAPPPAAVVVSPHHVSPSITAVRASGVLVVPPKPSYRYSYSYSAPDGKNPHRDNSAFVNVEVNQ